MAPKRPISKQGSAKPAKSRKRPASSVAAEPSSESTAPAAPPRTTEAPQGSPAAPALPMPPVVNSHGALLRFIDAPAVELNTDYSDADLIMEARDWNYRLRDRRRWSTRTEGVNTLRSQAKEFIKQLGVNEVILEQL